MDLVKAVFGGKISGGRKTEVPFTPVGLGCGLEELVLVLLTDVGNNIKVLLILVGTGRGLEEGCR